MGRGTAPRSGGVEEPAVPAAAAAPRPFDPPCRAAMGRWQTPKAA